jgi:hypothetical protein
MVGRLLAMFAAQTHEDRSLLILDDGGQFRSQSGDRWQLVSIPRRFRTLGEKNNAAMALTPPEADGLAKWDDDDLFSPWALASVAEALTCGDWVQPRHVMDWVGDRWAVVESFGRTGDTGKACYHSSWAYSRRLIEATGGYRPTYLDDDHEMQARLRSLGYVSVDIAGPPWYWYGRPRTDGLSRYSLDAVHGDEGAAAWARRSEGLPFIGDVPEWTGPRDWERDIPSEVLPRPF